MNYYWNRTIVLLERVVKYIEALDDLRVQLKEQPKVEKGLAQRNHSFVNKLGVILVGPLGQE